MYGGVLLSETVSTGSFDAFAVRYLVSINSVSSVDIGVGQSRTKSYCTRFGRLDYVNTC